MNICLIKWYDKLHVSELIVVKQIYLVEQFVYPQYLAYDNIPFPMSIIMYVRKLAIMAWFCNYMRSQTRNHVITLEWNMLLNAYYDLSS